MTRKTYIITGIVAGVFVGGGITAAMMNQPSVVSNTGVDQAQLQQVVANQANKDMQQDNEIEQTQSKLEEIQPTTQVDPTPAVPNSTPAQPVATPKATPTTVSTTTNPTSTNKPNNVQDYVKNNPEIVAIQNLVKSRGWMDAQYSSSNNPNVSFYWKENTAFRIVFYSDTNKWYLKDANNLSTVAGSEFTYQELIDYITTNYPEIA